MPSRKSSLLAVATVTILIAIPLLLALLALIAITIHLLAGFTATLYAHFPNDPSTRYQTFSGVAATIVAMVGVVSAIATFILNARAQRRAQRKQHTISILLEMRLSERFATLHSQRSTVFPEYQDVLFEDWNAARIAKPRDDSTAAIKTESSLNAGAHALTSLLNYYEFLAVGIIQKDLDPDLLKNTLRGIMCNLVDDSRLLIAAMRARNPKTYEHLVQLYDDWRIPGSKDINGNPNERPIPR